MERAPATVTVIQYMSLHGFQSFHGCLGREPQRGGRRYGPRWRLFLQDVPHVFLHGASRKLTLSGPSGILSF